MIFAAIVAACGSKSTTGGGSTPTPGTTPLVGCNSGAASIAQQSIDNEPILTRAPARGPQARFIPGKILVRFTGTGTEPAVAAALTRINAQAVGPTSPRGFAAYSIPPQSDPEVAAAAITHTQGIAEAKPILARYTEVIPNDPDFGAGPPYPTPTNTPTQWDMYYTQMPAAWGITEGSSSITIAVVDTGYDANNADVCQKVVNSAVFDLGSGSQDTNAVAQDGDGHGTNVSAIAAAVTNNSLRFPGVGWNIELLEVRVFPTPSVANPTPGASTADIASGIDWAVTHGAKVVNLSLGAAQPCDTGVEGAAISNAVAHNVAVIVAAGNDGASNLSAPANCNGAIAVGASALNDAVSPAVEKIASYSNWGSGPNNGNGLALVAPGGDPDTAQQNCKVQACVDFLQWIFNNYSTTAIQPGHHSVLIAGTSQATPHVSGVVALMYSIDGSLAPGIIRTVLQSNADDICFGVPACIPKEGAGRLNALHTLQNTP